MRILRASFLAIGLCLAPAFAGDPPPEAQPAFAALAKRDAAGYSACTQAITDTWWIDRTRSVVRTQRVERLRQDDGSWWTRVESGTAPVVVTIEMRDRSVQWSQVPGVMRTVPAAERGDCGPVRVAAEQRASLAASLRLDALDPEAVFREVRRGNQDAGFTVIESRLGPAVIAAVAQARTRQPDLHADLATGFSRVWVFVSAQTGHIARVEHRPSGTMTWRSTEISGLTTRAPTAADRARFAPPQGLRDLGEVDDAAWRAALHP